MSTGLDEQAFEQQMQWSLGEVLGGEESPDVMGKVLATVERDGPALQDPVAPSRWLLTVAIVTLGVAALFGVHRLSREQDNTSQATLPRVQEPKRHEVRRPEDVARVPVEALAVRVRGAGDDVIHAIAKRCPELESLHVNMFGAMDVQLTDHVFTIAASLPGLRELQLLAAEDVTGEGLEQLAALPRLEKLVITFARLRSEAYDALPILPSLRALDLQHSKGLDDHAMKAIARCPGLQQLSISECTGVTATGLALVTQIPQLESLEIRGLKCSWKLLGNRRPSRLRRLDASNTNFRNEHLGWLPHSLTELDLSNTSANANTCRVLTELTPQLRRLDLSGCGIHDDGIGTLGALEHLRQLGLSNSPFSKDGLQRLHKMNQLCEVRISALSWLTPADIDPLMAHGINVHVTEGQGLNRDLERLRMEHADTIKARRDRIMKH